MRNQLELLNRKLDVKPNVLAMLGQELAQPTLKALEEAKESIKDSITD
jgi:hypothetical protein